MRSQRYCQPALCATIGLDSRDTEISVECKGGERYERIMYQTTHAVNGERKMLDPEVSTKARRRTFTAAYKRRILEEADGCTAHGEMGALLRREGLYSSHLTTWRRQREAGELAGLKPKKRGRKKDEEAAELARLRRENERLRKQLEQAELIIAAQKKLALALESLTEAEPSSERSWTS